MSNVRGKFSNLQGKLFKNTQKILNRLFLKNKILQNLITETCKHYTLNRNCTDFFQVPRCIEKFSKKFHAGAILPRM